MSAAPSILASLGDTEDEEGVDLEAAQAGKLEFLSSILLQVYTDAASQLQALPRSVDDYTGEVIASLASSGVPNGFLRLVKDGQKKVCLEWWVWALSLLGMVGVGSFFCHRVGTAPQGRQPPRKAFGKGGRVSLRMD